MGTAKKTPLKIPALYLCSHAVLISVTLLLPPAQNMSASGRMPASPSQLPGWGKGWGGRKSPKPGQAWSLILHGLTMGCIYERLIYGALHE